MKQYRVLLIGTFVHQTLVYSVRPYISLLADVNGADSVQIGVLVMLSSLLPVVLALPIASIINRFGCRRITLTAGIVYFFAVGTLVVAHDLIWIAIAMLVFGTAYALEFATLQFQSTRGDLGAPSEHVIGYYALFNSLGVSAGSYIGGQLNEHLGKNLCFLGGIVIACLNLLLIVLLRAPDTTVKREASGTIADVMRVPNMFTILLSGGLVMFCLEVVNTYFPLYGQEIGLTAAQVGTVLSVSGVGQLVIRPFIHRLTHGHSLFRVLALFMVVSGCGIVGFGLTGSYAVCLVLAGITGAGLGILNPLYLLAVSAAVDLALRAKALAVRVMVNFGGQAIGPVGYGFLAQYFGYASVFWVSGGILVAGAIMNARQSALSNHTVDRGQT